jgi:hypothetical protein
MQIEAVEVGAQRPGRRHLTNIAVVSEALHRFPQLANPPVTWLLLLSVSRSPAGPRQAITVAGAARAES